MKNLRTKIIITITVIVITGAILFTGYNLVNLLIKMHGG